MVYAERNEDVKTCMSSSPHCFLGNTVSKWVALKLHLQACYKGQLMSKMLSCTLCWDADCPFPCPGFCFDVYQYISGRGNGVACLVWDETMNSSGPVAGGCRFLKNVGKPTAHQNWSQACEPVAALHGHA